MFGKYADFPYLLRGVCLKNIPTTIYYSILFSLNIILTAYVHFMSYQWYSVRQAQTVHLFINISVNNYNNNINECVKFI